MNLKTLTQSKSPGCHPVDRAVLPQDADRQDGEKTPFIRTSCARVGPSAHRVPLWIPRKNVRVAERSPQAVSRLPNSCQYWGSAPLRRARSRRPSLRSRVVARSVPGAPPGHCRTVGGGDAPLLLDADGDADAPAPRTGRFGSFWSSMRSAPPVRSSRFWSRSIPSAFVRLPGPRHRSSTATSAGLSREPPPHQRDAVLRFQRADQHRRGPALRLGHRVHEVVDAVVQVDVGDAGRTVERRVARGGAGRGVAGGIALADVGLDLDDHAGREPAPRLVHQHLADEIPRDVERRAVVEATRETRIIGGRSRSWYCRVSRIDPQAQTRPTSAPKSRDRALGRGGDRRVGVLRRRFERRQGRRVADDAEHVDERFAQIGDRDPGGAAAPSASSTGRARRGIPAPAPSPSTSSSGRRCARRSCARASAARTRSRDGPSRTSSVVTFSSSASIDSMSPARPRPSVAARRM